MFMVYWTQVHQDGDSEVSTTHSKPYDSDQMSDAMTFMEGLRKRKYDGGERIHFITMSSENPNQVGRMGVSAAPADYNWMKRRTAELRKDK